MADAKTISELFDRNYRILIQEFPAFEKSKTAYVAAAYYTSEGNLIDPDALGNACFLLKDSCAPSPALNGKGLLVSASILCNQQRDIESRLEDLSEICRKLNGHRESAGVTPSSVFITEENSNPLDWGSVYSAVRTLRHEAMSTYPALGELDTSISTAIVLSKDDPEEILSDAAEIQKQLKSIYGEKTKLSFPACMLALCGGAADEKTEALKTYTSSLKTFSSPEFLPVYISLLCSSTNENTPLQIDTITHEMKKKKGFGMLSLSSSKRLALCAFASQKHSSYTQELLALDHLCNTL